MIFFFSFFFFFLANLLLFNYLLNLLPIKFRGLDKIHMFGRGLFKEHLCKTFVKISAMR